MRSIIITGANSGIGLECTHVFCNEFSTQRIVAISRSLDNLKSLTYDNLEIVQCDVTDYASLKNKIENIGRDQEIDCLINCAGISYNGDFCAITHAQMEQIIAINVQGLTNCIELVLPFMRKQQRGTIINLSSLSDRHARPLNTIYASSKAYVKSLSESLRLSEAKYNIRITNIAPAIIDTPMLKSLNKNFGNEIPGPEFAQIVKFIYQQPQGTCIRDIVIAPTTYEN